MKRRKYLIFGLIFSMFLSGDSYLSKAYADDFQDSYRDNDDYQDEYQEDYQDRDSWDYYDWKRYWENNNRANETEDNNNTTENQGNWWDNQTDNNQNNIINNPDNNQQNNGIRQGDGRDDESPDNDYDTEEEPPVVDMSKVTLDKNLLEGVAIENGYYGDGLEFKIKVNSETVLSEYDNAKVSLESSNEDMYFYSELSDNILTISTSSSGNTTLTVTINDKEFKIKVKIKSVGFKQNTYIITKGKKEKLALKGGKNLKIKWKSSKPGIVSVDQSGRVKGLKEGNAIITAKIKGVKLAVLVSSIPEIKRKAVNWAINYVDKSEYSQPKRMQEGYYDCSSLVWRAYNKFGYKLAGANYAPVAAELCRSYENKKQTVKGGVSTKNVEQLKFVPGDLVFFTGEKNGRYKNIYHVEMIAGYDFYGLDSEGKPEVYLRYVKYNYGNSGMPVARVNVK